LDFDDQSDLPPSTPPEGCPPDVAWDSVYARSKKEIEKHKWLESEKAGRDMGETAVRGWVQKHWDGYLRERWMEHLLGVCYWMELEHCDFGFLKREFPGDEVLLKTIVGKLKNGEENLDVIRWAGEIHLSLDPVLQILEALDVNSRRLRHQFDTQQPAS